MRSASETPVEINSARDLSIELERLFIDLDETGQNNSVALWVHHYWESQILPMLAGESVDPTAIELDLTSYCTSSCFFCKEGQEKVRIEAPPRLLKQDIDRASASNITDMVVFSGGGEPTDARSFGDLLEYSSQAGLRSYISTHGGRIGISRLPHSLFGECADILKWSIGGVSHETYNQVHNNGREIRKGGQLSVDYVFSAIEEIAQCRRTEILSGETILLPRLITALTVSPLNEHEIYTFVERSVDVGADTVFLRPVISSDPALRLSALAVELQQQAILDFANDIEILSFNHRQRFSTEQMPYFDHCIPIPVVAADQGITPCVFRRANRHENRWLRTERDGKDLYDAMSRPAYQSSVEVQDQNLFRAGNKSCPGCRKVPNNHFFWILAQMSSEQREEVRDQVRARYPASGKGVVFRGLV